MDRRAMLGTLATGSVGLGLAAKGLDLGAQAPAPQAPGAAPVNAMSDYVARPFAFPNGLPGLSKDLLAEHLTLYKGYVTRTNALLKELLPAEQEKKTSPSIQELRRRLGFEFSGMRLHELYFESLAENAPKPTANHPMHKQIVSQWGTWDTWWSAFKATCTMPGIGWGALVKDPMTGRLMNVWVQDHENMALMGTQLLLVIDVWEHAYVKDHGATGRGKYVDALVPLIHWPTVERRF